MGDELLDDERVDRAIERATKGYPRPRVIWILVAVFVLVGALLVFIAPDPLLRNWLPSASIEDRSKLLGTAAQIVLFMLGGAIAVVGVALSLSRHRQEIQTTALEQEKEDRRRSELRVQVRRDVEHELRSRFVTAVELLASPESPTRRTAAFYAMAAVADDWDELDRPDEVQVCVDVICAYLRSAIRVGDAQGRSLELQVRTTAARIIRAHLVASSLHSWSGCEIDLSGTVIDYPIDLTGALVHASGRISLAGALVADEGSIVLDEMRVVDDGLAVVPREVVNAG